MEPPVLPDGEVTLAGAGHHAVSLNDVEKARRASVLAYCARVCDPASIAEAADAAFAEFRSGLEAAGPDEVVDLDRVLLEATRDAAGARVDAASSSATRLVSRRSTATCGLMPTLLAGRASGRLSSADLEAVGRHLARCSACRDQERRRGEAEQAYAALLGSPVPGAEAVAVAAAAEPFAPGDPEPEVVATRSHAVEGWELDAMDPPADEEVAEEDLPVAGVADEGDDERVDLAHAAVDEEPAREDDQAFEDPAAESLDLAAAPGDEVGEDETVVDEPDEPYLATGEEPSVAFDGWSGSDEHDEHDEPADRRSRIVIAAVLLVGIVIFAIGMVQLLSDDGGSSSTTPSRPAAQAPAAPAAAPGPTRAELRTRARLRALGDRDLSPGTLGDDVKALQQLLGVQQTGNYGDLTAFAVGQFQARHGLSATGIADAATKRKLARRTRPPKNPPTPPAASTSTPPAAGGGAGTAPPPAGGGTTTPPAGTGSTPAPAPPGQ